MTRAEARIIKRAHASIQKAIAALITLTEAVAARDDFDGTDEMASEEYQNIQDWVSMLEYEQSAYGTFPLYAAHVTLGELLPVPF